MRDQRTANLKDRLAAFLSGRPDLVEILLGGRPNAAPCRGCNGKGWFYAGDDDSLPIRRACLLCSPGQRDLTFYGRPVEEVAGDLDDNGRYYLDGDAA